MTKFSKIPISTTIALLLPLAAEKKIFVSLLPKEFKQRFGFTECSTEKSIRSSVHMLRSEKLMLRLVISVSGMGKVLAAATTQQLIDCYTPNLLLHIGSAGAIDDTPIGCMVLAEKIIEHDYYSHPAPKPNFAPPSHLLQMCHTMTSNATTSIKNAILTGTILSGTENIFSTQRRDELRQEFSTMKSPLAVDWESSAVAQICSLTKTPYLVLRAITDTAASNSLTEFTYNFKPCLTTLSITTFNIMKTWLDNNTPQS
ncbi:MAG: 5'-methylthioadenosine/S-adenosylhomocysteine nucleosidase [Oligoflexia bacterium]|nr:5'-methylthioadenosine/S-adenosylhomocysteine nucleosidase [Oligoflexia bacterium]